MGIAMALAFPGKLWPSTGHAPLGQPARGLAPRETP